MAAGPVLSAEHIELRPFDASYLTSRYVGWLNDPKTVKFSEQRHRSHSLESCRCYMESFSEGPSYFWAIIARDVSLGHIGNITATVDVANKTADLAILIGEAAALGKGYGREAWRLACRFLIDEVKLRKISAGTMATNAPMLRIMHASGMVEEGRRRRQFLLDGTEVDAILAAIFAD